MSDYTDQEVLQTLVDLMGMFRGDPYSMVDAGFIKIVSSLKYDADGNPLRPGGIPDERKIRDWLDAPDDNPVEAPTDFLRVMQQNKFQKYMSAVDSLYVKQGKPLEANLCKPRSVGATTGIMAKFTARTTTMPAMRSLVIAHTPKSARSIYRIGREMIRNLPDWMALRFESDSKEMMEPVSDIWGISQSSIACISTSNIEALRGERGTNILCDECARYDSPDEVEGALESVPMKSPILNQWNITTGNGEDDYFYPRFMSSWIAQGGENIWMPGAKRFKHGSVSMFFPFFYDPEKCADLHPDISEDWLQRDLDAEEHELFHKLMVPYWVSEGYAEKLAISVSLKQLYWRRCKLIADYLHTPKVSVGNQIRDRGVFKRENPAIPEHAFLLLDNSYVIPILVREQLKERHQRQPKLKGEIIEGKFSSQPKGNDQETVWIWKEPDEIKGRLVFCLDPAGGLQEAGGDWNNARDFHHGHLIEIREDGVAEQVAEFVSQKPMIHYEAYQFCEFYGTHGSAGLPYFICETAQGINIISYFKDKEYPLSMIYRHMEAENVRKGIPNIYGFKTSKNRRAAAVHYWQDMVVQERLIFRSSRTYQQMAAFVEKKDGKAEAIGKGRGGEFSKDDGILAACFFAYAWEGNSIPSSDEVARASVNELRSKLRRPSPDELKGPTGVNVGAMLEFYKDCERLGTNPETVPEKGFNPNAPSADARKYRKMRKGKKKSWPQSSQV